MKERALRRLSVSDVSDYLTQKRWTTVTDSDVEDGYQVYKAPMVDDFGDPLELVIPVRDDPDTSAEDVTRLIDAIASIEGRDYRNVEADVAGSSIDTLGVRLVPADKKQAIKLRSAPQIYREAYRLFLYGAAAELNPEPRAARVDQVGQACSHDQPFWQGGCPHPR